MSREYITLAHGAGGKEMSELIERTIISRIKNRKVDQGVGLDERDDSATIPLGDMHVVITTDSYTVNPIFFPGGNIGKLAITGTINDLAVIGAKPLAIVDALIVEEGFPLDRLEKIIKAMIEVAEQEDIAIIGGDFKVMPKGAIDKIVITTTGIGLVKKENMILDSGLKPGDKIVVSGTIGEHGATILALQSGIDVEGELSSDCAPVTKIMEICRKIGGVHAAKDPTRGGIAMALNELARKSKVMIILEEEKIPIREEVRTYCEMLGIDPLYLACEGRVVVGVKAEKAEELVKELRKAGYEEANIIGEVKEGREGYVLMKTIVGGIRIVEMPIGEIVPRIC